SGSWANTGVAKALASRMATAISSRVWFFMCLLSFYSISLMRMRSDESDSHAARRGKMPPAQ
ncbi:MAG: hypothetical protein KDE01_06530, partial [Caldilineaceae bacterium]|nr:hypothetical protein [Caldilineaceae bacterium]